MSSSWDTAGAERFKGVTTAYFRGAHGKNRMPFLFQPLIFPFPSPSVVILAYDISNEETLEKTR